MRNLTEVIRSEPLISRVFAVDPNVFLVGGYIRDLLRGVRSRDIDFIVGGDPRKLVSAIFSGSEATVVEFKRAMTLRVVSGGYTMDFSEQRGSLDHDLALRDFTMNAIAWSKRKGLEDPLNGIADIKRALVRGVSERNFMDDPLRLLRAYRFAGEFGWDINVETREAIRKLKGLISRSSSERITFEVIRLLNSQDCVKALKTATKDGVLGEVFSIEEGRLERNIKELSLFDLYLKKIGEVRGISPDRDFSQGLTYKGLLRAEQLLSGSNLEKNHLTFSRATLKRLAIVGGLLDRLKGVRTVNMSMFDLFTEGGEAAMDLALLSRRSRLLREAERFLSMKPVLPAEAVIGMTGFGSGPEVGAVLREMKRLQFLGKLESKDDAIEWLTDRLP